MFVDPVNMDYHLRAGARCIDAGAAFAGSGDTDLDGNPRAVGGPTDIGCYEYSPDYVPTTKDIYVAEDGDDANDGLTGETALATIGAAYAQATDGTHIVVGPGTFVLSDTLVIEKTIHLEGAGRDVTIVRAASAGYGLVNLANYLAVVSGMTLAESTVRGVYISNGGEVRDCRITGINRAVSGSVWGIAARIDYGYMGGCELCANTNAYNVDDFVVYVLSKNGASNGSDYGLLDNCAVFDNYLGSAASIRGSAVRTHRVEAGEGGAVRNSTITMNRTSLALNVSEYPRYVHNCIIRDQTNGTSQAWSFGKANADTNAIMIANATCVPIGSNCVTDAELNFRNVAKRDFSLRRGSPCIDAGCNYALADYETDGAGNPRRFKDSHVDIGAYEHIPIEPTTVIMIR